ncbi:maltokinase N-terminal cap-like domain-containing protein [Subtercola lobariae]|uniref:Maltokinase n=1 Tax=Subtercola lobariae TaxID=1588641 RepID=A0A917B7T2_9MICO|nr:phosphotransferase [Subtercola lobariae]GGF25057.1 trehalose biosynthesis protein [Subtercola lobariae]
MSDSDSRRVNEFGQERPATDQHGPAKVGLANPGTDELLAALTEWMPAQRWFAGKGTTPVLRLVGSFDLRSPAATLADLAAASGSGAGLSPAVTITTALVLDEGGSQPKLYQVPLTARSEALPELAGGLITTLDSGSFVYDGALDSAYATALLTLITSDESTGNDGGATASGRSQEPGHPLAVTSSRVLSGEQSNTSIIMTVSHAAAAGTAASTAPAAAPAPVICKVFRVLHHGDNPDVVLQSALAKAGSTRVPASVGSVVGTWSDERVFDGIASGHLAFAQEFLPGVRDAWRVALEAAEAGHPFTADAFALGEATAEVHETLAGVMPTVEPSPELIAAVLASMRGRHAEAVAEVPELGQFSAAVDRIFDKAATGHWPRLQRIHGDYHLGQVLAVPSGGWVLVDFEGEPLRPMAERNQPDLAVRDIAGMLRSFDYVAGSFADTPLHPSATAWAQDARQAFLDGYVARSGFDLTSNRALLEAFEIDKALYEAIYEARNRPTWLAIPVTAIARLAGGALS